MRTEIRRRIKLLRRGLVIAAVTCAVLVSIGEIAVRWIAGKQLDPVRALTPAGKRFYGARMFESVEDGRLHFAGRPGAEVEVQGVWYRHNALGLRERDVGAKPTGEFRVLLLGDSNVYGWGVGPGDTLAAQLERLLGARATKSRPIRVIGAGFPGYNTRDAIALFEKLHDDVLPDIVLLGWFVNDCERFGLHVDANGTLFADPLPMPESWKPNLWRSYLYRAVSLVRTISLTAKHRNDLDSAENLAFAEDQLARMAEVVHGARLPLVVLEVPELEASPGSDRLVPGKYRAAKWSDWLNDVAARRSFRLLSLVSSVPDRPLEEQWVHPGSGDRHPNALVLHAFAAATRDYLVREHLIP